MIFMLFNSFIISFVLFSDNSRGTCAIATYFFIPFVVKTFQVRKTVRIAFGRNCLYYCSIIILKNSRRNPMGRNMTFSYRYCPLSSVLSVSISAITMYTSFELVQSAIFLNRIYDFFP